MSQDHSPEDQASEARAPGADPETMMRALHRASLSLFTDLSLDAVLLRITQAAKDLSNARYAALGVPDGGGGLEAFITLGLSDDEVRGIGHQPVGRGLIGEMMRSGVSIRIPDILAHPKAAGFPDGHPTMRSFLGVPIAAYGRPLGQIYLTDKEGASEFTAQDQRLIEMLAAHAAAAIENAQLYKQVLSSEAQLTQTNEELELFNSLATAVSSAMELEVLLETMLRRVIELFGAQEGEIFLREEDEAYYHREVHRGRSAQGFWRVDHVRVGEGFIGRVAEAGKLAWTDDPAADPLFRPVEPFGTLVGVPLTARGQVVGVLCLAFHSRRGISLRESGLLEAVGAGVGVAVENARLYRQARRLAVLEERERIGMDLHDGIIQSIYAVGLTLEYTRLLLRDSPEKSGERLEQAIDGLNGIIRDIRSYILDLQPSRIATDDLPDALGRLVREFKANTLVETELQMESVALRELTSGTRTALFHIAQEALANIAKHARATRVLVSVRRMDSGVGLQVIDNGQGFDAENAAGVLGHGLSNMLERARHAGGTLVVASSPGEGTTVNVQFPVVGSVEGLQAAKGLSSASPKRG